MSKSQKRKLKIVAPKPFEEWDESDDEDERYGLKTMLFDECYDTFIWQYYDPRIYWKKDRDGYLCLFEAGDDFTEAQYDEMRIEGAKEFWSRPENKRKFKPEYIKTRFSKEVQKKWGLKVDPDAFYDPN
jgi:hypothetical protein